MKPIWKLYDTTTSKYLTEICTSADSADDMCHMLNESVAGAFLISVMDMIPDKRFSIYVRSVPPVGKPSDWRIYTDADTLSDAMDRILLAMDTEADQVKYSYKIVYTISPDMTVMEIQTGEFYPREKEGEK